MTLLLFVQMIEATGPMGCGLVVSCCLAMQLWFDCQHHYAMTWHFGGVVSALLADVF
jgi:hypothetical protein